jgi:hypothetical protein
MAGGDLVVFKEHSDTNSLAPSVTRVPSLFFLFHPKIII